VSIPQINQVDTIFVSSDDVGQFTELLREERFQVRRVRVVPRVFYLHWLAAWRAVHNVDARLVPDAAKEGASRQKTHLCDILARENLILAQDKLFLFKATKVHTVAAAETEFVGPVCFDYLVDVSGQKLATMYLDKLLTFANADNVDVALIFTTDYRAIIDLANGKDVALCHYTIENLKSQCINEVQHLLFSSDEK